MSQTKSFIRFIALSFLFSTHPTWAESFQAVGTQHSIGEPQSLNWDDLQQFLTSSKFGSVEDFLEGIRNSDDSRWQRLLSHSVLMYKSESLQRVNVSPTQPRVILFLDQLTLAFTNSKSSGGPSTLEVMAFNTDTDQFNFHQITLRPRRRPVIEKNPAICAACHQINESHSLTPRWRHYNGWPGAYGSIEDRFVALNGKWGTEVDYWNQFTTQAAHSGVYRFFDLKPLIKNITHGQMEQASVPGRGQMNFAFTDYLARLNFKRINTQLKPLFAKDPPQRALLAGLLLGCENFESRFHAKELQLRKIKIRQSMLKTREEVNLSINQLNDFPADVLLATDDYANSENEIRRLALTELFLEQHEMPSLKEWSMSRQPGRQDHSYLLRNDDLGIASFAAFEILPALIRENPHLREYFSLPGEAEPQAIRQQIKRATNKKEFCQNLSTFAHHREPRTHVPASDPTPVPPRPPVSILTGSKNQIERRVIKIFENQCKSCHQADSSYPPALPFHDLNALRGYRTQSRYFSTVRAAIETDQMPPYGANQLDPNDKAILLQALED